MLAPRRAKEIPMQPNQDPSPSKEGPSRGSLALVYKQIEASGQVICISEKQETSLTIYVLAEDIDDAFDLKGDIFTSPEAARAERDRCPALAGDRIFCIEVREITD